MLSRRDTMTGALAGALAAAGAPGARSAGSAETSPAWLCATDLLQALAARKLSARELTDACIDRIVALDGSINAVVVRDFDGARAAADAADAVRAKGEGGPLLGIPMTVKEQYNIAGLPTSWGFPRFRDWRPDQDALVVQRLKAAGAVILGKTNVPQGLTDWQSYNDVYGTTNNPWDLARTPGGSSGGAAAALAAGFVPLELGSDIGGSLRTPAHFCGVFSHKPSVNLIPMRGAAGPEVPAIPVGHDLAVLGPMARSAADLALELAVLVGPDPLWDGIGYRVSLPPPRHERLADHRILMLPGHPLVQTETAISSAVSDLADRLARLGCTVMHAHREMPDLVRTTRVYIELLGATMAADESAEQAAQMRAAAEARSPEDLSLTAMYQRGASMSHTAWVGTSRIRAGLRVRWQALLRDIDAVICPVAPTVAFPHDHSPKLARQLDVDGHRIRYGDQIAWPALATVIGLPATVVPIGRSPAGLPIGMQIIGGYLSDLTTIALGGMIEREFGGFTPPPRFV